jgi:hypothetical protein
MLVDQRVRELREAKNFSQGDGRAEDRGCCVLTRHDSSRAGSSQESLSEWLTEGVGYCVQTPEARLPVFRYRFGTTERDEKMAC